MSKQSIATIVANHLQGANRAYLEDISSHGIHNVTNRFHGNDDAEYEAFTAEFKRQATDLLNALDEAERADD